MLKRMKILLVLLICIFPFASYAQELKEIGQITEYTGEVLVRSNGNWKKLDKVPYTVHSSDKIVTNKGRAQIKFYDGDKINLDVDSNVSINQGNSKSGKGFIRQVNMLLGKLHFDIVPKKADSEFRFNPTLPVNP